MSSEALAWAMKQFVRPSGAKFTLVALCECANYKTGRITPSIAHLVEITGQNRKTVIAHVAQLEAQGYITDTGERCGLTKQIKVYSAAIGTVPKAEQSLKRNSPGFDLEQSQKRDTEPSWEPSTPDTSNEVSTPPADRVSFGEAVEGWNNLAGRHGLPRIERLTDKRKRQFAAQARRFPIEDWTKVWAKISQSPFLLGQNDREWRCDFDFLLTESNFVKILEGKYDRQSAH